MNPTALQRYQMKKQGYQTMVGPGDAEILDDDVYASAGGSSRETEPRGLVDRLYQEEFDDEPIRGRPSQSVPTTKNRY